MSIAIDLAERAIHILVDKSVERMEKNHRFLEILKRIGVVKLENDFDSIYIHALVDYGNTSEPVELTGLFSAKPVRAVFKE
ncbi:MAG: hypothetical protein L0Y73_02715, partial [Candidatus Aminicenantes bacterium]|nr:hypothetical protein [Candidatus Aminicenantes bacterium]